jgi:biotin carboxyl carrier protein
VFVALDRKKGNADYSNLSNQFISLIKGEYGKTPVPVDPAFRQQITGDATERPYDVSKYKKPENPTLDDLGGVKLASNTEEMLLLELLPNVANGFLRKRRAEENKATQPAAPVEEKVVEAAAPITGEVLKAPMGGRIVSIKAKPGDKIAKGEVILVYEAMKMENDVVAEKDLVIKRILVEADQVVNADQAMVEFIDAADPFIQVYLDLQLMHLSAVPLQQISQFAFIRLGRSRNQCSAKHIRLFIDHRLMTAQLQNTGCFHTADPAADNDHFLRVFCSADEMLFFLHRFRIDRASCQMQ